MREPVRRVTAIANGTRAASRHERARHTGADTSVCAEMTTSRAWPSPSAAWPAAVWERPPPREETIKPRPVRAAREPFPDVAGNADDVRPDGPAGVLAVVAYPVVGSSR